MTNCLRVAAVIAGCVAALASASAPKEHHVNKATKLRSDYDSTWSAVIDAFSERDWTIENMEKDSGLITTDWMNAGEEGEQFADCGNSPLAGKGPIQVRFNVRVKEDDGGTSVTVNTRFRRRLSAGGSSNMVDCTSRGVVETMVHNEVMERSAMPRRKARPAVDAGVEPGASTVDAM
jgi:hypothetical protein